MDDTQRFNEAGAKTPDNRRLYGPKISSKPSFNEAGAKTPDNDTAGMLGGGGVTVLQ